MAPPRNVGATHRKAAARTEAGRYSRVEAGFALWEMLTRDNQRNEAVVVARVLFTEFPENQELARFIEGP